MSYSICDDKPFLSLADQLAGTPEEQAQKRADYQIALKEYNTCIALQKSSGEADNRPAEIIAGLAFGAFWAWLAYGQYQKDHKFWFWLLLIFAVGGFGGAANSTVMLIKGK
jgi:fatty acid desaturase